MLFSILQVPCAQLSIYTKGKKYLFADTCKLITAPQGNNLFQVEPSQLWQIINLCCLPRQNVDSCLLQQQQAKVSKRLYWRSNVVTIDFAVDSILQGGGQPPLLQGIARSSPSNGSFLMNTMNAGFTFVAFGLDAHKSNKRQKTKKLRVAATVSFHNQHSSNIYFIPFLPFCVGVACCYSWYCYSSSTRTTIATSNFHLSSLLSLYSFYQSWVSRLQYLRSARSQRVNTQCHHFLSRLSTLYM